MQQICEIYSLGFSCRGFIHTVSIVNVTTGYKGKIIERLLAATTSKGQNSVNEAILLPKQAHV